MKSLEESIGYQFKNKSLLKQALTHRSFSATHYERLEFLGDSVLNLAITARLYAELHDAAEGDLSRIRAHLVKEATLCGLGIKIRLNEHLLLGEGELRSGGKERASIIADALEAIIGAVYLDAGYQQAKECVNHLFQDEFKGNSQNAAHWGKDPKTALQEWLQALRLNLPLYDVVATHGALHEQVFSIQCSIPALELTTDGQGASRRLAEQEAAKKMFHTLIQRYGESPKHIKTKHL